jgi:hypothetical protein
MPFWARCLCMAFGIANVLGGIASVAYSDDPLFSVLGGLLVGGCFFAFGKYGGLPLIGTVQEWHPPVAPDEVTEMHRSSLLVMRRRRWTMWASYPGALIVAPFVIATLFQVGQPGLTVLVIGVPMSILMFRYALSRCPRCGFGFFALSKKRATTFGFSKRCRQCGLSLYAYRDQKAGLPNNRLKPPAGDGLAAT